MGAFGDGFIGLMDLVESELKKVFHDLVEKGLIKNVLLSGRGFFVEGLK